MKDFFSNIDFTAKEAKKGNILISEPFQLDPYFKRTVVLITEHGAEGSVGFILNKPLNIQVSEVLPDFPSFKANIYFGGPVGQDNLYYIHTLGNKLPESIEIIPGLYWGGNFEKLRLLIDTGQVKKNEVRFFVGYSGWSPGQLKDELDQKSWVVANTKVEHVMLSNSKTFWKNTLSDLGKKYAIMANFPENPNMN